MRYYTSLQYLVTLSGTCFLHYLDRKRINDGQDHVRDTLNGPRQENSHGDDNSGLPLQGKSAGAIRQGRHDRPGPATHKF